MKKVFVADKMSYGAEFYKICNTLDELKRAIVTHEEDDSYTDEMYTEELFKEHCKDGEYTLHEVNLDETEKIIFSGYDGQSWFRFEKIEKNILSRTKRVEE
jgi:hypothetical protein